MSANNENVKKFARQYHRPLTSLAVVSICNSKLQAGRQIVYLAINVSVKKQVEPGKVVV
ncbi:hypothetical protein [Sporomusa sp. KB1]|uniref:hypothetical protein n=1 Tax=Sporomusa sp. KB1 TaxID=943346 RepID=UPI0011AB9F09|nr:hypothetical protein [Sporomusa sp. KB1]TWH48796.1 hypothetical protein Salpa_4970 [Sporomusa sp. KB1]